MTVDLYEKQKETHGTWATWAWIGSGAYLFATTEGASFISWQTPVFFLVGTFVAALVFGLSAYGVQRGIAKILMRIFRSPSLAGTAVIGTVSVALFALEVAAIFLIARWVLSRMI